MSDRLLSALVRLVSGREITLPTGHMLRLPADTRADRTEDGVALRFPTAAPRIDGAALPVNSLTVTADDRYLTIAPDVKLLPGFLEAAIRIPLP